METLEENGPALEEVQIKESESSPEMKAFVGRLTIAEIEKILSRFQPFVLTPILYWDDPSKNPKVQAGAAITSALLKACAEYHETSLDVVMLPLGTDRVSDEFVEAAVKALAEKKSQKRKAAAVVFSQQALEVCRRLKKIGEAMRGVDTESLTSSIVRQVVSLGPLINSLWKSLIKASESLLAGDSESFFQTLRELVKPEEKDVEESISLAIDCIRAANALNQMGVAKFEVEDLAKEFLAGLLANAGLWGGNPGEDHARRGAEIVRVLMNRGRCIVPDDLPSLIRHHGYKWTRRYVFESSVMLTLSQTGKEGETVLQYTSYDHRDEPDAEQIIAEENYPKAQIASSSGQAVKDLKIKVRCLSDQHILEVLIVTVCEEYRQLTSRGKTPAEIFKIFSERIKFPSNPLYNPASDLYHKMSPYSYVLAAKANDLKILPERALVLFCCSTRGRSAKQFGLDGGVAVSFGGIMLLFGHLEAEGKFLERLDMSSLKSLMTYALSSNRLPRQVFIPVEHSPITREIYRGERRMVVGFLDTATYHGYFHQGLVLSTKLQEFMQTQASESKAKTEN